MEQHEWTTSGKRERKQASSQDTSIPRAPLSFARLWSRRYMPIYLTASVSQSVNQSVSHPCLPDYLTTLLCLPVCLLAHYM